MLPPVQVMRDFKENLRTLKVDDASEFDGDTLFPFLFACFMLSPILQRMKRKPVTNGTNKRTNKRTNDDVIALDTAPFPVFHIY